MNINFCFIDGISLENEPYFASLQDQDSYFDSLNNTTIITSTFYPPYYRNTLKVDTSDISLDSNYNYVWFEYNGKRYYYFLSNVRYISEDLLAITITMDTIQTYYFDIKVHSAVVRRKFIDRKTSIGDINRNYIRENVSVNLKELKERLDFLPADNIKGWYFIIQTNDVNHKDTDFVTKYTTPKGGTNCPYYIQAVPDYNFDGVLKFDGDNVMPVDARNKPIAPWLTIAKEASLPVTLKIVYVPGNIFASKISAANGVVTINGYCNIWHNNANGNRGAIILSSWITEAGELVSNMFYDNLFSIKKDYSFDFEFNASKAVAFDKHFVPALLDENYINISFGDSRNMSTIPLHLLQDFNVKLAYYADYLGYCYYNIEPYVGYFNEYNTIVSVSQSCIDLIVSRQAEYDATNRWNMAGAIVSTIVGIGASVLTANPLPAIGAVGGLYTETLKQGNQQVQTKYAKGTDPMEADGRLRGYNPKRDYHYYEDDTRAVEYTPPKKGISIPGYALYSFSNMTNVITAKANAYSAPSSVKSYGTRMQDLASGSVDIRYEVSYVHDIDACAQYYHRYGYLVNEYIQPTTTLFADMNTRYYYNYIELAECDIELSCLQFDSCVSDIETRLISGIRLWNPIVTTTSGGTSVTYDIGNYSYDNVERSALNG